MAAFLIKKLKQKIDQEIRLKKRNMHIYSDFNNVKLPILPEVPGQISSGESRYLYWLISEGYTGSGAIVELGTWLGKSTIHLAAGLRDSGYKGTLFSYDNFIWGGGLDNKKSGLDLPQKSDYFRYFKKYTEQFSNIISVNKIDFTKIKWPANKPVEIIFFDGPKTAKLISATLKAFSPAFIPGHTLLVFQDYQHSPSYETPIAISCLGNKLKYCHSILSGGTVSFLLNEAIMPQEVSIESLSITGKSIKEYKIAWESIMAPLEGFVLMRMKSAMALNLCDLGEVDEAIKILRTVEFNERLHSGWTTWSTIPHMQKRYKPLFDIYTEEIQ